MSFTKDSMRFIKALPFLCLLILATSCSSDSAEQIKDLFATVPADAEIVAVCNIAESIKHSGGKISDGNVENADRIITLVAGKDAALKKRLQWILSPESGISAEPAVCFFQGGAPVVEAYLSDADKFRKGYLSIEPGEWTEVKSGKSSIFVKEGIGVCGNKLIVGRNVNADYAGKLLGLSEVESFNSVDYSEKMTESDDDITLWGDIDRLLSFSSAGFAVKTQIRLGLGMLFNNPKYLVGNANFDKKGVELETYILDNTLKPSKCELELSKIDPARVASLGGNANGIAAIAVSGKLVKQIQDVASSAGGALPAMFSSILSPLDGTIAIASEAASSSPATYLNDGFRMTISTNGKEDAQLAQTLQAFGAVDIEGKILNVSKGSYGNGALSLQSTAEEFKDAWFGVAYKLQDSSLPSINTLLIKGVASDNTLKLRMKLEWK